MNRKKIVLRIIIFAIIVLAIAMIIIGANVWIRYMKRQEDMLEYRVYHYNTLRCMGVMYDPQYFTEEELQSERLRYYVDYPGTELRLILPELDRRIYIYNLLCDTDIKLTGEDIYNIYYTLDEEKVAEFKMFEDWYNGANTPITELSGHEKITVIYNASAQAMALYKKEYGELYCEVDYISEMNVEAFISFTEWILANPDYEFAAEYDEYYQFLDWMGLIPESERREVPGKEEELYDEEIYVVE